MQATRYYDFLMAGMVAVLLCSNLIGPAKLCQLDLPLLGLVTFGAGNLFFPISYIFGDVLTEVYGYARARRAIWAGFAALVFATLMSQVVLAMPAVVDPRNSALQGSLLQVFGGTWRIVVASMVAYWVGDFVNSYVMAKMKIWTHGKHLWSRTIGSTLVGQFFDSALFYPLAFYGEWSQQQLIQVLTFNLLFKVGVEVLMTPITYWVVHGLKQVEQLDVYDQHTAFTPFSLRT